MAEEKKLSFPAKVQKARTLLMNSGLKKTGYNPYSKYYYFDLGDFIPPLMNIMDDLGLYSHFTIVPPNKVIDDKTGQVIETPEIAQLKIMDVEDEQRCFTWEVKTCEAALKGATEIQLLGSKITYLRRYLWQMAMEIVVSDDTEVASGEQKISYEQEMNDLLTKIVNIKTETTKYGVVVDDYDNPKGYVTYICSKCDINKEQYRTLTGLSINNMRKMADVMAKVRDEKKAIYMQKQREQKAAVTRQQAQQDGMF